MFYDGVGDVFNTGMCILGRIYILCSVLAILEGERSMEMHSILGADEMHEVMVKEWCAYC